MKTTRKLIQILNYIAYNQPGKVVGFMKAYKLLWLIDRYSLRHYARMVSGDQYFAMKLGPVPSDTKNLLEGMPTNMHNSQEEVNSNLEINRNTHKFSSRVEPVMTVFSKSDIDTMNLILSQYGGMRSSELSTLSHEFPEWKYYEERLHDLAEKDSFPINPDLFFEDYDDGHGVFLDDTEKLNIAKELYNYYNN